MEQTQTHYPYYPVAGSTTRVRMHDPQTLDEAIRVTIEADGRYVGILAASNQNRQRARVKSQRAPTRRPSAVSEGVVPMELDALNGRSGKVRHYYVCGSTQHLVRACPNGYDDNENTRSDQRNKTNQPCLALSESQSCNDTCTHSLNPDAHVPNTSLHIGGKVIVHCAPEQDTVILGPNANK